LIFNLEYLTVTKIGLKCRTDKAALRKDENKVDRDLSYGELQQSLIDTYREGHFKTIEYTEKLLEQYKRQLERVKSAKDKKKYQSMIAGVEKELQTLRNKTRKVLKDIELLQNDLDSLK
jgi:hypothetical protein